MPKPAATTPPGTGTAQTNDKPATEPSEQQASPSEKPHSKLSDPKPQPISETQTSGELNVAAASDLRFVFVELENEFMKHHAEVTIKPTFGSSGTFFAQISNQAPFDVFLSADLQYAQKLVDNKLAVPDSLFRYAVGHIVLWVRNDSPLQVQDLGIQVVKSTKAKKVAIANPATAPYGRAAESALKKLDVYDAIKEKLVLGDNVAQAAQFAETGAADVAVIGLSFASAPAFAEKGRFWKFPGDSFPKLEQAAVIVKASKQQAAAKEFCDFLQSDPAKVIFRKYGFEIPEVK